MRFKVGDLAVVVDDENGGYMNGELVEIVEAGQVIDMKLTFGSILVPHIYDYRVNARGEFGWLCMDKELAPFEAPNYEQQSEAVETECNA
jgi:hypothetical protein